MGEIDDIFKADFNTFLTEGVVGDASSITYSPLGGGADVALSAFVFDERTQEDTGERGVQTDMRLVMVWNRDDLNDPQENSTITYNSQLWTIELVDRRAADVVKVTCRRAEVMQRGRTPRLSR